MTRTFRGYIFLCGLAVCAGFTIPATAVDVGHVLRKLSHRQIVGMQRGTERLARTGKTAGSPSLRIPALSMADADVRTSALIMAASWDEKTARTFGGTLARAARSNGTNVLSLPAADFGMNPFLASHLLAGTVRGVQAGRVVAALFGATTGGGSERSLRENIWPQVEYAVEASNAAAVTCRSRSGATSALCGNRRKFATMLTREAHFNGFGIDTRSSDLTSIDRIINTMSRVKILGASSPRGRNARKVAIPQSGMRRFVASSAVLLHNDARVLPFGPNVRSIVIVGGSESLVNAMHSADPQAAVSSSTFEDPSLTATAQNADACIIVLGSPVSANEAEVIRSIGLVNAKTVVLFDRMPSAASLRSIEPVTDWSAVTAAVVQPTPQPEPSPTTTPVSRRRAAPTPSPTPTPTLPPPPVDHAPAVLLTWGLARTAPSEVARLILGSVSPSGHLPIDAGTFAFGTGLTYSTFTANALKISYGRGSAAPVTVSFVVRNSGTRTATTVEQLYLRYPASVPDSGLRSTLVAFARVSIAPGKSKRITFPLSVRSFAYWSSSYHAWFVAPGTYHATIGTGQEEPQVAGDIHITAR